MQDGEVQPKGILPCSVLRFRRKDPVSEAVRTESLACPGERDGAVPCFDRDPAPGFLTDRLKTDAEGFLCRIPVRAFDPEAVESNHISDPKG